MIDPKIIQNEKSIESQHELVDGVPLALRTLVSPEMWSRLTYEQRSYLLDLRSLPPKLVGVVPESVWGTLSDEQKLEFLFSHSILPRNELPSDESLRPEFEQFKSEVEGEEMPVEEISSVTDTLTGGEVLINKRSEVEEAFDSLKERVRKVEESAQESGEEEAEIPPEDIQRIKVESGATFTKATVPRFAGYQPTEQLLSSVDQNLDGDPASARTWASNIIHKIWMALGQT